MIAQSVLECKPILSKKFPICIDIPYSRCYDKEKFERKELINMLNMKIGNRSLAPVYAQLA